MSSEERFEASSFKAASTNQVAYRRQAASSHTRAGRHTERASSPPAVSRPLGCQPCRSTVRVTELLPSASAPAESQSPTANKRRQWKEYNEGLTATVRSSIARVRRRASLPLAVATVPSCLALAALIDAEPVSTERGPPERSRMGRSWRDRLSRRSLPVPGSRERRCEWRAIKGDRGARRRTSRPDR